MGCVYKLENRVTGMMYIGHTKQLKVRKNQHLSMLRKGEHYCVELQKEWNEYGEQCYSSEYCIAPRGRKGNRTNHPPRAGVAITPSKGGRNKRTFWITDEDLQKLKAHAAQNGKSLNDALSEAIGKL